MRIVKKIIVALIVCSMGWSSLAWAEEGETAIPAGGKAPLVLASDSGPRIQFQVGADLMGGGLADVDFIGGVNATFLYPVIDMLWVGIRPSLHYLFVGDEPYDETWMHGDVALHLNFLHDPVRVYLLAAGGYAFALDTDIPDLSHGYSAMGGVGVAWKDDEAPVGLFCEVGFRYGAASHNKEVLQRDASGDYIYNETDMRWETETIKREFEMTVLTINLGLTVSP